MAKNKDTALLPVERITHSILIVRGQRMIIDRELAVVYGAETRTLHQAVKRNAERFPEDFRFSSLPRKRGRGHNGKFLPYAFT